MVVNSGKRRTRRELKHYLSTKGENPTEFTEKELIALNGGEPDAALFDIPAKYREVSPSERILGPNKQNRPYNENLEKILRMMDEDYKRAKESGAKRQH